MIVPPTPEALLAMLRGVHHYRFELLLTVLVVAQIFTAWSIRGVDLDLRRRR